MIRIRKEEAVIVTKDGKYNLYSYKDEAELESMIVEHSSDIFGKNTYYFDIKKKIKSKAGFGTIPDGYVIDLEKDKLFVLEVELTKHDLRRHIMPQIQSFDFALSDSEARENLVETFITKANSMSLQNKKFKNEEYLRNIVNNNYGIIILIDDISPQLGEFVEYLSSKNIDVTIIPFKTYVKSNNLSVDHIHSFTSLTREGLEKEAKKWTFKWATVPVEKHLNKLDDNSKIIFNDLGKKICCIAPDIKEVHRKSWATYQISKLGNFCTIKFPKGCLEIHMKVNKKTFTDKKKITKNIRRTPAWTFDKVFTIKSQKDIDYAVSLIEQAYKCICKPKIKDSE